MRPLKPRKTPTCSWCGTKFRGTSSCPRGPACALEEAENDRMLDLIEQKGARK